MKPIFLCFFMIAACAKVPEQQATEPTPEPAKAPVQVKTDCAQISRLARVIMQARQTGTSMEQSMDVAKDDDLTRSLVVRAYSQPHYQTAAAQERAANDFADVAMLECLKG